MDGVQARIPKIVNFNNGNVQYELLIRNNTIISNLGKYEQCQVLDKPTPSKISEVLNISVLVSYYFCYMYIYLYPYLYLYVTI